MTTLCRVVLADDHILTRQGLRRILQDICDLEVVGEADDGLEAVELVRRLAPDLVVLDISMPHLRGIEAIHEIKRSHPEVKVLILTMYRDREYLTGAMTAGAAGYLLKEDAEGELFAAIEKIRGGGIYVSPKLSDEVIRDWTRIQRGDSRPASEFERLTVREREVVKLIAEGQSSREIGERLGMSYRTVEHHRAMIMAKLKLKGTADIVKYAIAKGYL